MRIIIGSLAARGTLLAQSGKMGHLSRMSQRAAISRHRGSIDVSSQEGEGTTFTIRLPINAGGAGDSNIEEARSIPAP